MRAHLLILATLTSVLADCGTVDCRQPDEEDFTIDATFSESEVVTMLDNWGLSGRDEISCEIACRFVYDRDRVWMVDTIQTCEHTITDEPVKSDAKAGDIRCEGHGEEYGCD